MIFKYLNWNKNSRLTVCSSAFWSRDWHAKHLSSHQLCHRTSIHWNHAMLESCWNSSLWLFYLHLLKPLAVCSSISCRHLWLYSMYPTISIDRIGVIWEWNQKRCIVLQCVDLRAIAKPLHAHLQAPPVELFQFHLYSWYQMFYSKTDTNPIDGLRHRLIRAKMLYHVDLL